MKYPNVKTSLNFEGEIVTFILGQNRILCWVLLEYDDDDTVYSAKYFNYLSDYQLSLWFISLRSVYLSLYSVDGRKTGECGIGKDFERGSYVLTYYPDICQ